MKTRDWRDIETHHIKEPKFLFIGYICEFQKAYNGILGYNWISENYIEPCFAEIIILEKASSLIQQFSTKIFYDLPNLIIEVNETWQQLEQLQH